MTSELRWASREEWENEGRGMKIKKGGVGMAAWLVILSACKSGMEMEQNARTRNDIPYSLGAWACVSSRGPKCVRPVRSRANKFPFQAPRCSTLVGPSIEFHGEFRDTGFGRSIEDQRCFVSRWRENKVCIKLFYYGCPDTYITLLKTFILYKIFN